MGDREDAAQHQHTQQQQQLHIQQQQHMQQQAEHRVRFTETGGRGSGLLARCDDRWPAVAAHAASVALAACVVWYLLRVNLAPALTAVPGGSVASVFLLYVAGAAAGRAAAAVDGLPPLLGMMVAGIALQNCGLYTVTEDWCVQLVAIMRCVSRFFGWRGARARG